MEMTDVLSFENHRTESEKRRCERIQAFQHSLNDVFRQFQELLDDYKEVEEKYEALYSKKSLNVTKEDKPKCCACSTAAAQGNNGTSPPERSVTVAEEEKLKSDVESVRKKTAAGGSLSPTCEQSYQIFSQDFCTQGLEESFLSHGTMPLHEIQNVTPKRSKSPIFGSKKGKATRPLSSPVSSPSVSEKSVVILNDFTKMRSKSETLDFSNCQFLSQPDESNAISTPKTVQKWGLSTIQNINTDVIVGSKKKLKQSKILLRAEKVTDLSTCDDFCDNKSSDRNREANVQAPSKINCTQIDNSSLEDSLIQGSPTQDKDLSRARKQMARRNKSAETLQKKFIRNYAETIEKDDPVGQTDTETTIFEPNLASTHYGDSPSHSKALETDKIDNSEIIDDTLFVENVTSSHSWSQKKQNSETSSLKTKSLSLKRIPIAFKNPQPKKNGEASVSSPDERKGRSPPRKKLARAYFDVPAKRRNTSPTYVYKRSPVRKQAEKKLLDGWSCLECQNYYEALDLPKDELQKRKNACSRHRSKFDEQKCTPNGYWNPDFTSSFHSTIWGDD